MKDRHMRAALARILVRWASNWYQAAANAGERGMPNYEAWWVAGARRIDAFALPLACRLDREAAVTQAVKECWWG